MAKFQGNYKKITLEEMMNFIEKNDPEAKSWFKEVSFKNKNGEVVTKYNHLNAKRAFCEKYAPDLLPKKAEKASDRLKTW